MLDFFDNFQFFGFTMDEELWVELRSRQYAKVVAPKIVGKCNKFWDRNLFFKNRVIFVGQNRMVDAKMC